MPGTDMCIKIGGWVRSEVTYGTNGSSTTGVFGTDYNNRTTNNLWTRERGYITADAREQTAYGVARGYIAVGVSSNNTGDTASSFSSNRAFVQWAGFTAGLSVSFFDFYPAARTAVSRRQHSERRHRRRRLVGLGLYRPVRRWFLRHAVGGRAARLPDCRL